MVWSIPCKGSLKVSLTAAEPGDETKTLASPKHRAQPSQVGCSPHSLIALLKAQTTTAPPAHSLAFKRPFQCGFWWVVWLPCMKRSVSPTTYIHTTRVAFADLLLFSCLVESCVHFSAWDIFKTENKNNTLIFSFLCIPDEQNCWSKLKTVP